LTVWSKWMKIGQNGWLCTYWSKMPFFNKRSPPPQRTNLTLILFTFYLVWANRGSSSPWDNFTPREQS
jgi:hypothetical protein